MKKQFTKAEMDSFLNYERDFHDVVRLVDPAAQNACFSDGSVDKSNVCSQLLGRASRCENCSSLRALQSKGRAFKLEMAEGKTFWVYSRYVNVEGHDCVVETIDEATDGLLFDAGQENKIGRLIANHNHLVIHDGLTEAYNRRFLDNDFIPSLRFCQKQHLFISVAMVDIDRFKNVNDTFGHQAGDAVLKRVAAFWRKHFDTRLLGSDRLVCRYGGDEFLIVACGESPTDFVLEMGKLSSKMPKAVSYRGQRIPFSTTYGSSGWLFEGTKDEWHRLIDAADAALYGAKALRKSSPSYGKDR